MNYEVRCECGKAHAVTGADAGASLACACGRTVEVPPLHQLRAAAGQLAAAPEMLLTSLLVNRELPDGADCTECGRPTDGVVWADVACERAEVLPGRSVPVGCLPIGFGILVFYRRTRAPEVRGRNVGFRVPVRCCHGCAPALTGAALVAALRRHPACAGVLDKYPHARITRAG
jgi:hypothetical protein